ncbi:MAG TPA: CotH kinase family protein [Iamia sp.]
MPVPVRLVRRLALSAVLVLVAGSCGGDADDAAEPEAEEPRAESSPAADDEVQLFDSSVVHAIELEFDEGDYDAMVETYADSGEKEWIEATATIDGTTYERVGLRLKGNSSLFGVGGTEEGGGGGPAGGPSGGADADDPASLPWLIRLDEYVEGQEHQQREDIVIRSNSSETSLNEAVALELLEDALLPSQQAIATSFVVNGSDAELRLAVENPDDDAWQDASFESEGALYKAESTGTWEYRGDDPASYEEVFDQEGGKDVADLSPLIDLLQFVDESDDETFSAELEDRLDVEAFATYLAAMELLGNFDDIDGPGNNAYLWYDVETERFTIVPWDLNLALGSGGGFPGGGGGPPEGFEPPAGGEMPEGFEPPAGGEMPEGGPPGGGFGRANRLVERFHADEAFEAIYQYKLGDLRADLFETGDAQEILDRWVDVLTTQAGDLVDAATVEEEAESVASHFEES